MEKCLQAKLLAGYQILDKPFETVVDRFAVATVTEVKQVVASRCLPPAEALHLCFRQPFYVLIHLLPVIVQSSETKIYRFFIFPLVRLQQHSNEPAA